MYFIPNIYSEDGAYSFNALTFNVLQYVDANSDNNKILQVISDKNSEMSISNATLIQDEIDYIVSKLSSLTYGKNVTVLQSFLNDLSEEIEKKGNNDSSIIKWLKTQIDTEGIDGPTSQALIFLARDLNGTEATYLFFNCFQVPTGCGDSYYESRKSHLADLISQYNYSLPESEDERDAKSIDFLLAVSPRTIYYTNSINGYDNTIFFSDKEIYEITQAGRNEHEKREIEGIIYLIILEGYNKGGNITKLLDSTSSFPWSEDNNTLWLRTLSKISPLTRNKVIDLATSMSLNGNEDKIYENLIEAGQKCGGAASYECPIYQ